MTGVSRDDGNHRAHCWPTSARRLSGSDRVPWLHGVLVDTLCGYCLLYVISIPLLVVFGQAAGSAQWPVWLV